MISQTVMRAACKRTMLQRRNAVPIRSYSAYLPQAHPITTSPVARRLVRRNAVPLRSISSKVPTWISRPVTLVRRNAEPLRNISSLSSRFSVKPASTLQRRNAVRLPARRFTTTTSQDDKDLYVGMGVLGAFFFVGVYVAGLGHLTPYFMEQAAAKMKRQEKETAKESS